MIERRILPLDPMSNPESSESPQVKLMHEWGSGFRKRDLNLIVKALHKDYRHIIYPRSLGMPEQTREEWFEHFAGVIALWTDLEVTYISCSSNSLHSG